MLLFTDWGERCPALGKGKSIMIFGTSLDKFKPETAYQLIIPGLNLSCV